MSGSFWAVVLLWGGVLGVGGWYFRHHPPTLFFHILALALLLPAMFPPHRTLRTKPVLLVDVSRSMDVPSKQDFAQKALDMFRTRFGGDVFAFAERTVPYEERARLRGYPTRPPRVDGPALILSDGLWEGWASLNHPVWTWIPERAPAPLAVLDVPFTVAPGPVQIRVVTSGPGTLVVGEEERTVQPGTSSVRVVLPPGFHRIQLRTGVDTLERRVLARSREVRVGIFARKPHPDVGALRRALEDVGVVPVVVLGDRILLEDRVQTGSVPAVWGWFLLDLPVRELPGMWEIRMGRALEGARWTPHPLLPGVERAVVPGAEQDTFGLVRLSSGAYGWVLRNVYRLALRSPESLRTQVEALLGRMRDRHPRVRIYAMADRVNPPDTARFWVEVLPEETPVDFSLSARPLEPGLYEISFPVPDTGVVDTSLGLTFPAGQVSFPLRARGVFLREEPVEIFDTVFLARLARNSGGDLLRGPALPDLPLPARRIPWPSWPFLLFSGLALVGRWAMQSRSG